jgi:hypothetical protein
MSLLEVVIPQLQLKGLPMKVCCPARRTHVFQSSSTQLKAGLAEGEPIPLPPTKYIVSIYRREPVNDFDLVDTVRQCLHTNNF